MVWRIHVTDQDTQSHYYIMNNKKQCDDRMYPGVTESVFEINPRVPVISLALEVKDQGGTRFRYHRRGST